MHKNKDGNLVNIDRGKHVSRNNETINIKICLKKKKNGQIPLGEVFLSILLLVPTEV